MSLSPGRGALARFVRRLVIAVGVGCGTLPACGRPAAAPRSDESTSIVLVEVPAGGSRPEEAGFRDPYPRGSRIVVFDPERPRARARVLTSGFDAAGSPVADPSGRKVLFVGRRAPGDSWRVYTVALSGGPAAAISPESVNATSACWLPGDRVVFSSDGERTIDPSDGGPAYSLYAAAADGSALTRITFDPGSEIDPTVLGDGRILYSGRQPPDPGRLEDGWLLLTVNSDGTGVAGFYAGRDTAPRKQRARQLGGRVLFLEGSTDRALDRLATVEMRRPQHSHAVLAPGIGGGWRSGEDWDGSRILVTQRSEVDGASFGVRLLDPQTGEMRTLRDDPALDEVDAVPARPRTPPRGRLSLVDPSRAVGEFLCLDARRTDRSSSGESGAGAATTLLVEQALPVTRGEAGPRTDPELPTRPIAWLPLSEDGSVFFEAPADTPLRFRTLDATGNVVMDSVGWVWLRPGEKRGCIGCHEDPESAPTNRFPQALTGDAPRPRPFEAMEVPPR